MSKTLQRIFTEYNLNPNIISTENFLNVLWQWWILQDYLDSKPVQTEDFDLEESQKIQNLSWYQKFIQTVKKWQYA